MHMRGRYGFTLIELLVVIAIISMLAAILFPVFSKARGKAWETTCTNNQRQIAVATTIYLGDHEDTFPAVEAMWTNPSLDRGILQCPVKGKDVSNAFVYSSMVAGVTLSAVKDPTIELLTADGTTQATTPAGTPAVANTLYAPGDMEFRHNNGCLASFVDGHVERITTTPAFWIIDLVNLSEFDQEVLKSPVPVMVHIYDPADQYCKALDPIVKSVAKDNRGHLKVVTADGTKLSGITERFSIEGYPTLLFFKKGTEQDRILGYTPDIRDKIDAALTKMGGNK